MPTRPSLACVRVTRRTPWVSPLTRCVGPVGGGVVCAAPVSAASLLLHAHCTHCRCPLLLPVCLRSTTWLQTPESFLRECQERLVARMARVSCLLQCWLLAPRVAAPPLLAFCWLPAPAVALVPSACAAVVPLAAAAHRDTKRHCPASRTLRPRAECRRPYSIRCGKAHPAAARCGPSCMPDAGT